MQQYCFPLQCLRDMTFNMTFNLLFSSNCKSNPKNGLLITSLSKNVVSLVILSP